MSRNVLFVSTIIALTGTLALFADPKAGPDPVGPNDVLKQTGKRAANQNALPRPGAAIQPQTQAQWKNPDHALATCVAVGNQHEIILSEIGTQKAQNEDVKKFAEMLVSDHRDFLKKLEQFAPEATREGFLNSAPDERAADAKAPAKAPARGNVKQAAATDAADEATTVQQTAGTKTGEGAPRGFNLMQIERELAQQCLMSSKQKLEEKTDAEFDKCFIGMQIGMHMAMKDKLIVFQRHASSELNEVLAAGQQKTEEHLAKAEELMKTLEGGSTTAADAPKARKEIRKERTTEKAIEKAADKE